MNSEAIQKAITNLEASRNIRVLFAVESGSRAWGFEGDKSDYDLRFVYVQAPENYLKILPEESVIDIEETDGIDYHGWDLRKALFLMRKSNPSLLEWIYSPIVYTTSKTHETMKKMANTYFNPKNAQHHYLSMAASNLSHHSTQETEIEIKRYLYTIRATLAAYAIHKTGTVPPVSMHELLKLINDEPITQQVTKLIELKKTNVTTVVARVRALDQTLAVYREAVLRDIDKYTRESQSYQPLDALF